LKARRPVGSAHGRRLVRSGLTVAWLVSFEVGIASGCSKVLGIEDWRPVDLGSRDADADVYDDRNADADVYDDHAVHTDAYDGGASSGSGSGSMSGSGSGTGSGSASGTSSGSGASGSSSGAPDAGGGFVCPAIVPNAGSTCPHVAFDCEYGTSPNLACNQLAHCAAYGWTYLLHGSCPVGMCLATYDQTQAAGACNADGLTCAYLSGTCICGTPPGPAVRLDGGASGALWVCRPATPSCHSPRPSIGTPCSEEGRSCDYGSCMSPPGVVLLCRGGVWQEGPSPPCPL